MLVSVYLEELDVYMAATCFSNYRAMVSLIDELAYLFDLEGKGYTFRK